MKTLMSRIAGMSATVVIASSMAAASFGDFNPEKAYGKECYAMVADHAGGMKSIEANKGMAADKQVVTVAAEFKQIMNNSESARRCYLQKMNAEGASEYQKELKMGAYKTGAIFDEVSLTLLEDVAPAAGEGAEADLAAEAQMEAGMELLIDSYMLLENAQALGTKMARITSGS